MSGQENEELSETAESETSESVCEEAISEKQVDQEPDAVETVEKAPGETDEAETEKEIQDTRLDDALAEIERLKDVALRAEAEMQNVRRRAERDVANAHKFGLERILQSILPVVDGLEKAIESATGEDDPVIEGVRLTFKLLQDVLDKEAVEVIDPVGEPFDPNLHEAMSMVENADMEPNSVFAVVQKGYSLNQRLVRPAMVMVTRAPAENS